MAEVKKYYWLKLNENFFEKEEIKVLENMPNGKDYIIFYLKLLLKSIKTEGQLKFRNVIPYTPEMLSAITNTDIDTVRVAVDTLIKLGLIEQWDDGTLFMNDIQNMIGNETEWAVIKRKQRSKQLDNVQKMSLKSPTEIDIDIDKDIDKEKDKKKKIHYAEFVTMTEEEYNKLVDKYGEENTKRMIEKLDNYKGASGKKYKSDYRAILNWVVNEVVPNQPEPKKEIPQSVLEQIRQKNEEAKKLRYDPKYLEEVRRIVQQS